MAVTPTPKFSVITAVFNGADNLETCLQSVADQQGVDVEHIVIDGGSTDGCVEILERWSNHLAYWHSRKDGGIADAMNLGAAQARGDWIVFVHADDYLATSTVLSEAATQLPADADVAAFPVLFGLPPRLTTITPRAVGWPTNFKLGLCHQGVLMRRSAFLREGGFDTGYRVCMDYDLLLRAYRNGSVFVTLRNPVLAVMTSTGVSSRLDWDSLRTRFLEEKAIHYAHARTRLSRIVYDAYWALYMPYRRLRKLIFNKRHD